MCHGWLVHFCGAFQMKRQDMRTSILSAPPDSFAQTLLFRGYQQFCKLIGTKARLFIKFIIGKSNQVWWSMIENRTVMYKDRPIQMLKPFYKFLKTPQVTIKVYWPPAAPAAIFLWGQVCPSPGLCWWENRDCSGTSNSRAVCHSERHLSSVLNTFYQ